MQGTEGANALAIPQRGRAAAGPLGALRSRLLSSAPGLPVVPIALALITFLVFSPSIVNDFVEWDDQITLYENEHYRGLGWTQIRWMFTNVVMGHYIPLTWLTFGLDYVLWGMDPTGYHLTSVALFALNAFVFYFVALRLLTRATSFRGSLLRLAAATSVLFFALHPLRAESVAWATERRDVLSGLFFLLTILTYLKASEAEGVRRRWLLAGTAGVYLLALASKGSVVVLPALLVVLDVYPLRRLPAHPRGWWTAAARRIWLEKVPFVVLAAAGAAVTVYAQNANMFITPLERYPLSARPAMTFFGLWFYAWKTVVPVGLSPLYELPARVNWLEARFLVPTGLVLTAAAGLLALRRRWPAGLAVGAAYAITLAPVIGIVHSGHQLAHDRYSYLPGFGLALLAGAGAAWVVRSGQRGTLRRSLVRVAAVAGVAWLAGLAYLTAQQVQIWRDTDTLWRYALESDPTCAICNGNIGVHLFKRGHIELARAHFERVAVLRPDNARVHQHLGLYYVAVGQPETAIGHYTTFLKRYPANPDVLNNMGAALIEARRFQDALPYLRRAITVKPAHPFAHTNLGVALYELGQADEAVHHFRAAIALKWDSAFPWYGLVRLHRDRADLRAALGAYGILTMLDRSVAGRIGPAFLEAW